MKTPYIPLSAEPRDILRALIPRAAELITRHVPLNTPPDEVGERPWKEWVSVAT